LFTATSYEKKLQALEKSIATAAQRLPEGPVGPPVVSFDEP